MGQGIDTSLTTEVTLCLSLEEHNAIVRATKIKDITEAVRHVVTTGLWLMNLASFSLKKEAKTEKEERPTTPKRPHLTVIGDASDDGVPDSIKRASAFVADMPRDKHITKDQWYGQVKIANEKGDAPITSDEADDFWLFLSDKQFINSNNFTVTVGNVRNTFAAWRQLRRKEQRRDEAYKAETERQQQEAEDVHDRRNRFMLTDVPED